MMPKPHFSWSQFYVYDQSPERYFMEYVMGVKQPATRPMILGSIAHKAFEDRDKQEWKSELMVNGFTPDYERGIDKACNVLPVPELPEYELRAPVPLKRIHHEHQPLEYLAFLDGFDPKEQAFHEYKTGSGWTQARVDSHEQLTMYAMMIKIVFGKYPKKIFLHHVTLPSGKVKTFQTRRTGDDVRYFQYKRLHPVLNLIHKEVFHAI